MNYLKLTIILLMILTTLSICMINPKIHKRVVIGNLNPVFVAEQNQNLPSDNTQKTESNSKEPRQHELFKKHHLFENKSNETKPTERGVRSESNSHTKVVKEKPTAVKPSVINNQKQLTPEEEEIIAWNTWRSNLQNKVMRDTKISAPLGTRFRFSFTVDREGNISNLKVWSDNSDYTSTAVRVIKPTILSYQGRSILNFPPKSKRVITNVNGEFTIWYQSGFSSPSDYSDYERVRQ